MAPTDNFIICREDPILVTGAAGFIGPRVVQSLLRHGFRNVRCLTRSPRSMQRLAAAVAGYGEQGCVEILSGNLLSSEDCAAATANIAVIYHLAAGAGEKSVPAAFLNSVVTTRNLLDAALKQNGVVRFVNVSSLAVYDNAKKRKGVLDETCPIDLQPERFGDAYEFAKVKQDQIVSEYAKKFNIPIVTVRPGFVYGPGRSAISGRVGIGTFGLFLHLGGPNEIPLTFVDNCAEAIVLAGLKPGIEGEVLNVIDDDLPSSRNLLRLYKRNVKSFRSLYLPHALSYLLCTMWEWYSAYSDRQLPPAFSRKRWYRYWKKTRYSNEKVKTQLDWAPHVLTGEGLARYFESCRSAG